MEKKHLDKIEQLERKKHHPFIHEIHKKHRISLATLFYMKEYGKRSHAVANIVKESFGIVLVASLISSVGGFGLETVKEKIFYLLPLLIMIPALNDMVGDFGTIISSKFTSLLFTNKISLEKGVWSSKDFQLLIKIIAIVAFVSALYLGFVSYFAASVQGFLFSWQLFWKIIGLAVLCTMILVFLIVIMSIPACIYVYRHKEDPNNFLIPITTAFADFGSLLLFSFVVIKFF